MSAYLENLYSALRTRINATWTDVTANGIYEAEHVDLIPWADLTPPYAVLTITEMPGGDWGMQNLTYQPMVEVWYVGQVTGSSGSIRAKLEAMRDDLRVNDLTTGQVIDITDLSWSDNLVPNNVFLSKGYMQRAGRLIAECVIGEVG